MNFRKQFFRTLFFAFLLTCLLTGLIGTVRAPMPVRAAPKIQATTPTLRVIINEVAWGGTIADPKDEWIELYNPGGGIDITDWLLISDGNPPDINITLSGSISQDEYHLLERQNDSVVSNIPADQIYFGPGNILDDAGETLYLYAPNASGGYDLIDVINSNGGPWPAGVPDGYGSMERYGVYEDTDYMWMTNLSASSIDTDFRGNPIFGTPKNINASYSTTPTTTTTITSDSPDPSVPNAPVNVSVTVTGGPTTPTGTVNITGADTNCVITLNNTGTGNCNVNFATIGQKTLTASYSGDAEHLNSIDTESHEVVNPISTTTVIKSISPNPAYATESTLVTVEVTSNSGSLKPTGTVNITGANTNCTATLSNGVGSCNVTFSTVGSKTVTASYAGDGAFIQSSDQENIDVYLRSTTTITADTPDPSGTAASVSVTVTVTGAGAKPTGTVNITGANTNCTITLSDGTGNCSVVFTFSGTKTLTATYSGDNLYLGSTDTESHTVQFIYKTPTPRPGSSVLPPPPPPLLGINEFVPRPGSDWNNDGVVNNGDEYIELINHGVVNVILNGYRLDDEANIGSNPYALPNVTLQPGERIVLYGSQTGLLLSDGGDGVRLLKSNGQLVDAYNYSVVEFPDQSFCRLPDNGGLDDWNENCYPTPGLRNSLSGSILQPPTLVDNDQVLCPIADTLPQAFVLAECTPFGNNIWNRYYWDKFGWYGERALPFVSSKWEVFAE